MEIIEALELPGIYEFLSGEVKTLGWGVLEWCSKYLGQPDGKFKGERWQFSNEQALFILRYYAVDGNGRFLFNRAILERPKGWGKSPLLAALCCAELLGPVRFSHFDDRGLPVGRQEYTPLIQIAAISEDQANNTYYLVMEMLQHGPAYYDYNLRGCILLSKVHTADGGIIQKVTASPRGREGQRVTFVVCDETHLWVPAEKGPELFDAIRRNAVKMDNRIVETTNAPVPGEMSVAEKSHEAVLQQVEDLIREGKQGYIDILLDTREVTVKNIYDKLEAMPALRYVYGDAAIENGGWVNLERIYQDVIDPSTTEHMARRFYFNQRLSGHTTWLNPDDWAAVKNPRLQLFKDDPIALGFKVVPMNGAAVLIGCRLTDGALFNLSGAHWERPAELAKETEWEIPHDEIDSRIENVIYRYNVFKVLCDPQHYQDIVGKWAAKFGDSQLDEPLVEEFWTANNKTKMARAVEQFSDAVVSKRLSWMDGQLNRHVLNCHTEEVPGGLTLRKETPGSKRYIVAAQAAVLSLEAATLAIEEGALAEPPNNTIFSF